MLLVSGVEFSDSLVAYNTQCSLHHAPFLMPTTQLPHSPNLLLSINPHFFNTQRTNNLVKKLTEDMNRNFYKPIFL